MANDPTEFELARHDSERAFCQAAMSYNPDFPYQFVWIEQTEGQFDKKGHTDAEGDVKRPDGFIERVFVDVKHVKPENMSTGNYSIGADCIEYFKWFRGLSFFAFRLNDGKARHLDSFLVAKTRDVIDSLCDTGREYTLCSIQQIKEKCPQWWILEKDF